MIDVVERTCDRCGKETERRAHYCRTCDIRLCFNVNEPVKSCYDWHRCGKDDLCPVCKNSGIVRPIKFGILGFSIESLFGEPEPCKHCDAGKRVAKERAA